MSPKKRVPLKDIEVISDPKIIKLMMEPTRAAIIKLLASTDHPPSHREVEKSWNSC
jgi:hypothetical protein